MFKIRTEMTDENISFLNKHDLSVTQVINNLVTLLRINDALGEENELSKTIQAVIHQSKKQSR